MKSSGTIYWSGMNSDALIETDLANNDLSAYIFMNGKRVGRQLPTSEVDFYFTDTLGTSRYVYSLAGANTSDFYPFGGERPISTGTTNHYKFTGNERDSESGAAHGQTCLCGMENAGENQPNTVTTLDGFRRAKTFMGERQPSYLPAGSK
jgi:hypothetical protein